MAGEADRPVVVAEDRRVLLGLELDSLSELELIQRLQTGVRVFARATPEQKMKIVNALQ